MVPWGSHGPAVVHWTQSRVGTLSCMMALTFCRSDAHYLYSIYCQGNGLRSEIWRAWEGL